MPVIELYRERRIVCVFLRHAGCLFCRQTLSALNDIKPKLDAANVALVAITLGSAAEASTVAIEMGFTGEMYTDATSEPDVSKAAQLSSGYIQSYSLYKLNRVSGAADFAKEEAVSASAAATIAGFESAEFLHETSTTQWSGDVFQLGALSLSLSLAC